MLIALTEYAARHGAKNSLKKGLDNTTITWYYNNTIKRGTQT